MLLCIHTTVKSHAKIKDRLRNTVSRDQPWFVPLHCELTGSIFSAGIGAANTKVQSLWNLSQILQPCPLWDRIWDAAGRRAGCGGYSAGWRECGVGCKGCSARWGDAEQNEGDMVCDTDGSGTGCKGTQCTMWGDMLHRERAEHWEKTVSIIRPVNILRHVTYVSISVVSWYAYLYIWSDVRECVHLRQ